MRWHSAKVNSLLHTKDNVKKSGYMLSPDVMQLIDILINEMDENDKLYFQLQHAWQNNGEYIEYKKEIVH